VHRDEVGLPQQLLERRVGHLELALEAFGLASRAPVENAHAKAARAARDRAADASAAADEADGLAVHGGGGRRL
jgi:hypothetical protein